MSVRVRYRELSSPPELADNYLEATVIPFEDAGLEHSMLVPRDWQYETRLENIEPSPGEFTTISLFMNPLRSGVSPFIDVGYTKMGCEVNIFDLLNFYKETYGMNILNAVPILLKGIEVVDCLVETTQEPICTTRMILFVAGDKIFKVSGTAEKSQYEEYKEAFHILVGGFKLPKHPGNKYAEPLEEYQEDAPIPLRFSFPKSWSLTIPEGAPPGKYVADLRLIGEEQLMGYIRVKGIDKAVYSEIDLNKLYDDALEEFSEVGLHTHKVIDSWNMDTEGTDFLPENISRSVAGEINQHQVEVRVTVLQTDTGYYVTSALIPAREANRLVWMREKRAMEIVLLSLNRPEKELLFFSGLNTDGT